MKKHLLAYAALTIAFLSTVTRGSLSAAEFITLGQFDGQLDANMDVWTLSGNGSAVFGYGTDSAGDRGPWRWTEETGFQGLGTPPLGVLSVFQVSHDGSIVFGTAYGVRVAPPNPLSVTHLFRWTQEDGLTDLGNPISLPVGSTGPVGMTISAMTPDGSAVIGYVSNHAADPSVARGFRWTQQFGFEDLGGITGLEKGVYPLDLSSSGNVVVGWNIPPGDPVHEGFTWTPETGMVSLGQNMSPSNVSADGSVIVGTRDDGQKFRYTDETGVEYLGPLPEGWSLANLTAYQRTARRSSVAAV